MTAPRVAWVVQSHRAPEQITRLLATLRRGSRGPIVLRHDPNGCALDPGQLAGIPDLHWLTPTEPQRRGQYSCQMRPLLDAIDLLEDRRIDYDWLINLSAQDYPVTPLPAIERFLASTRADGFLRHWDVRSAESPWSLGKARRRYWYRYVRLDDRFLPLLRALRPLVRWLPVWFYLDYGALVGARRWRVPFDRSFRCYGGWTWFSLRREPVRYLRETLRQRPELEAHYRGSVAPEESLVQTVLVNARRFALVDDDCRYIDYRHAERGSPRTLTGADWPILASGRYHFARKFDLAVDAAVVDRIDRELLATG
jgi:hypothetical protein